MQLKRDTEYAMQIMVCIAETLSKDRKEIGITETEILTKTGLPKFCFLRICGYLEEHHLIYRNTKENGEPCLCPGESFWEQSLFSIAEAVEGNMQIFVIFPDKSHLIQAYGQVFRSTQQKIQHLLSEVTMASLVGQNS